MAEESEEVVVVGSTEQRRVDDGLKGVEDVFIDCVAAGGFEGVVRGLLVEGHVVCCGVVLGRLGLVVVFCLLEVNFDDGALRGGHAEGFPEPLFVAEDGPGEDLGVKHGFDGALPDFALLVECLGGAELLDVFGHAEDTEEPASDCEGIARTTGVVKALRGWRGEDSGAIV